MHQFPKLISIRRRRDLRPLFMSRTISTSANHDWSSQSSANNITILDCVVVSQFRSASRRRNVRVVTTDIEKISFSTSKLPSEIAKHVEVKSSILVMLSSNDAFASQ